jgi:hypothetical protein
MPMFKKRRKVQFSPILALPSVLVTCGGTVRARAQLPRAAPPRVPTAALLARGGSIPLAAIDPKPPATTVRYRAADFPLAFSAPPAGRVAEARSQARLPLELHPSPSA